MQLVELVVADLAAITRSIEMSATLNEDEIKGQVQPLADLYIPYLPEKFALGFEVQGSSPV